MKAQWDLVWWVPPRTRKQFDDMTSARPLIQCTSTIADSPQGLEEQGENPWSSLRQATALLQCVRSPAAVACAVKRLISCMGCCGAAGKARTCVPCRLQFEESHLRMFRHDDDLSSLWHLDRQPAELFTWKNGSTNAQQPHLRPRSLLGCNRAHCYLSETNCEQRFLTIRPLN